MNLKERGITVGDLLMIIFFILTIFFIINKVKDDKTQTNFYNLPNEITTYKVS